MTNAILRGKPDAGNPHVRFDEGEVASAKPRRGSLLYIAAISSCIPRRPIFCRARRKSSNGSWPRSRRAISRPSSSSGADRRGSSSRRRRSSRTRRSGSSRSVRMNPSRSRPSATARRFPFASTVGGSSSSIVRKPSASTASRSRRTGAGSGRTGTSRTTRTR